MSFILLLYVGFLMVILFMKYKNVIILIGVAFFLIMMTSSTMVYGLIHFQSTDVLAIFNAELPRKEFLHLIVGWYVLDAICIVKIIRNYREYRIVNRNQG